MTTTSSNPNGAPRLALALGGGGARAAYQVGVLRALAQISPTQRIPLLTGVSAGAINIAHLANHPGPFVQTIEALTGLWYALRLEDVFATSGLSLISRMVRIGLRMSLGWPPGLLKVQGMVDTQPLRNYLHRALRTTDGSLSGVDRNLEQGRLEGVAMTALSYGTGNTVSFFRGRNISAWERPRRRSIETPLTVEHIMASAALPLFFPAVRIGHDWFGDGGIRLVAPLGPAVHLGADKILTISPHIAGQSEVDHQATPPSPATVLAALYNAVFLDQLDQDALQMERINQLIQAIPAEQRNGLKEVKLLVIRPSQDLGELAYDLKGVLPPVLRFLLERFGSSQVRSEDFMSTVLFHHMYIKRLIEIGERDGLARADEIQAFLQA